MYFCEQQTIYGGVFAPLERAQELSINLFSTWRAGTVQLSAWELLPHNFLTYLRF